MQLLSCKYSSPVPRMKSRTKLTKDGKCPQILPYKAPSCKVNAEMITNSVVTVQDFAFPVGFDRFLTPNFG